MFYVVNLLCILIIVAVHEYGHLLAAKRFGVAVPEFSVGAGPLLASFTHNETQYALRLFPIGGYVRIPERAMAELSRFQKIIVYLAGPLANLMLAVVVMLIAYLTGIRFPMLADYPWYMELLLMLGGTVVFFFAAVPMTLYVLYKIFTQPVENMDSVSGPIGIFTGSAVPDSILGGFSLFHQALIITYLLSISVGTFNLLPISFLDGGRILGEFFSRTSKFIRGWNIVTTSLFFVLIFYVLFADVFKLLR